MRRCLKPSSPLPRPCMGKSTQKTTTVVKNGNSQYSGAAADVEPPHGKQLRRQQGPVPQITTPAEARRWVLPAQTIKRTKHGAGVGWLHDRELVVGGGTGRTRRRPLGRLLRDSPEPFQVARLPCQEQGHMTCTISSGKGGGHDENETQR